jgi:hypothetical protein
MRFFAFCIFMFACIVWYRIQQPHSVTKEIERTVTQDTLRPYVDSTDMKLKFK